VHGRCIGARLRFGQRIRADRIALRNRAYIFLLLFFGAVLEDAVAEQRVVHRHDGGRCRIGCGDLDHRQHIADRIQACTAVFVRHFDTHQAELAHLADVVQRKLALRVEFGRHRHDALLREVTRDGLNR
jgi:hypothetical protein